MKREALKAYNILEQIEVLQKQLSEMSTENEWLNYLGETITATLTKTEQIDLHTASSIVQYSHHGIDYIEINYGEDMKKWQESL